MSIKIASWNIQYTKGADGNLNLVRIANYLKEKDLDIICLQEVGRNLPELFETNAPDQLAAFKQLFPDYNAVWASGISWPINDASEILTKKSNLEQKSAWRLEFGNLTLIKNTLPIIDQRTHALPLTDMESFEFGKTLPKFMPRACSEICLPIVNKSGDQDYFRLFNLHLAYHNQDENLEQLKYLTTWQKYNIKLCKNSIKRGKGIFDNHYLTDKVLLCGDFNALLNAENYNFMSANNWRDAWLELNGNSDSERPSTCGIYDSEQWQNGAHTRDYFMHQNLIPTSMAIDTAVDFSDHQPIFLNFTA